MNFDDVTSTYNTYLRRSYTLQRVYVTYETPVTYTSCRVLFSLFENLTMSTLELCTKEKMESWLKNQRLRGMKKSLYIGQYLRVLFIAWEGISTFSTNKFSYMLKFDLKFITKPMALGSGLLSHVINPSQML